MTWGFGTRVRPFYRLYSIGDLSGFVDPEVRSAAQGEKEHLVIVFHLDRKQHGMQVALARRRMNVAENHSQDLKVMRCI